MIDLGRESGRSPVLTQGGKVGSHLPVEQGQLLQFAAREVAQLAAIGLSDQGSEAFPVRGTFLNPAIGEDGMH